MLKIRAHACFEVNGRRLAGLALEVRDRRLAGTELQVPCWEARCAAMSASPHVTLVNGDCCAPGTTMTTTQQQTQQ
eukprot:101226-Chlamydomonas_euryale.AAC.1